MNMREIEKELRKPNTLLVLGNGFDLHCGLHSSFKDFFNSEMLDFDGKPITMKITSNIWYIIFYYAFMLKGDKGGTLIPYVKNEDPLWMDIEEYISKVFSAGDNLILNMRIYDFINNALNSGESSLFNDEVSISGYNMSLNGGDKEQKYNIKQITLRLCEIYDYRNAIDLLFRELKRFENDFSDYLISEINNNKVAYKEKVDDFLLNKMDNYGSNEVFVLSFNYTNQFEKCVEKENVLNLHGTLKDKNIIIGVDNKDNAIFSLAERFKKLDRRMQIGYLSVEIPDSNQINQVVYYGCSLGMLDYSYYSFIFKKYRLGESKTKFVFLYSDFCKTKEENETIRRKYIDSIKSLIMRYLNEGHKEFDLEYLFSDSIVSIIELNSYK